MLADNSLFSRFSQPDFTSGPWMLNQPIILRQPFQQKNPCGDDHTFRRLATSVLTSICRAVPDYSMQQESGTLQIDTDLSISQQVIWWNVIPGNFPHNSSNTLSKLRTSFLNWFLQIIVCFSLQPMEQSQYVVFLNVWYWHSFSFSCFCYSTVALSAKLCWCLTWVFFRLYF